LSGFFLARQWRGPILPPAARGRGNGGRICCGVERVGRAASKALVALLNTVSCASAIFDSHGRFSALEGGLAREWCVEPGFVTRLKSLRIDAALA
jgi:hypothetical protein